MLKKVVFNRICANEDCQKSFQTKDSRKIYHHSRCAVKQNNKNMMWIKKNTFEGILAIIRRYEPNFTLEGYILGKQS